MSNASLFRSRSYWLFIPFILVFCIILTLVLRQSAKASSQVHYLPDGNSATIQSYINDYAQNGDTLIIPSGTYNISSSVNITKSVTIKGQGVSSTTLRDANNGDGFKINANNVRIEDIKFQQVAYSGQIGIKIYNVLDFVIRNCEFRDYNGRGIETKGNATRGVVSGCSFYSSADATAIVIFGVDNPIGETPRADSNWVACPRVIEDNEVIVNEIDFGSADWVFIEDCYFEGWRHAISSNQGSKYVFRYNECYNASQPPIDVHGLESGHPRGSRAYEIYCNYIHDSSNKWAGIHIRGGDGVIWGNTILNRTHGVMLQNTIYNPGTQFTYIADDQTLKLYIWDNEKAGGAAATVTVRGTYEHLLVEDRDFFLYPMPGYEPYPYPHPLLEGTLPTPTPTPTPTSSSTPSPTPSALINDLDVKDVNNKNKWSVQENLQVGDVQYGDRSYVITSLPSYFAGCDWIRTANTSRSYTQSPLVTFTVGADAIVYIAHQDDITTKPSWMNNWVDTGYDLVNDEPTPKTYSIFAKSFGAGQTVSLGPNGSTSDGMYTIIVKRDDSAPTPTPTPTPTSTPTPTPTPVDLINDLDVKDVNNKNKWSVQENLQVGDVQYGDRSYVITSLPSYFAGCDWIRTANASKLYTQSPLVTFTVGADAVVYIAQQDDISPQPGWLSDWVDTGYDLVNNESTPKTYSIYSKSFEAGQLVSLGPNGDTNCGMYTVIVKEQP